MLLLTGFVATTVLLKLYFVWRFQGFLTGDDLEIVQVAAKYALGVRYQPWNIRCFFHPLVLVWPFVKAAALFGIRDPRALTAAAALPTLLFSTAAIPLVFRLARRMGAAESTALAAAVLYGLHPLSLSFGSTPFPRPISTALLIGAFLLASRTRVLPGSLLGAGALAAAAFAVRWSEGVVLIPLAVWSAWRSRSLRSVGWIAAGFAGGALLFAGVVDRLTWGSCFASLVEYFRQMYFEASPIRMAEEDPFPEYFKTVLHWAGPLLLLLLFAAWKDRRSRAPVAIGVSVVLLLSCFAHKEWRYLQAAVPFLSIAAAFGWKRLYRRGRRALAAAALFLAVPYGLERSWTRLSEKSGSGIQASRFILDLRPRPRVLALEQMWAWGEHLYLGNDVEIREIEYNDPFRPRAVREAAAGADVIGVYTLHLDRSSMDEIRRLGFRRLRTFRTDTAYECGVYARPGFHPTGPLPGSEKGAPERARS